MKKFFIKHRNVIMAIVSALLMLGFSMLSSRPNGKEQMGASPAGSLNGKKVTESDLENARAELEVLGQYYLITSVNPRQLWDNQGGDDSRIGLYWYLIVKEAQRYVNTTVTPERALEEAQTQCERAGMKVSVEEVERRLNSQSISKVWFAQALSHYWTFLDYLNFLEEFPPPVSAVELTADRYLRKLQLAYVPIDAAHGWRDVPDKDVEKELQAQFDAYKNTLAAHEPGPDDPPIFLGAGKDTKGTYALIGYPDAIESPAKVYEGGTLAWDGSKVERIVPRGTLIDFDPSTSQPVFQPYDVLGLSGSGRIRTSAVSVGQNIHGDPPPATPGAVDLSGKPADPTSHQHFSFGYKQPDMVKVEYLVFNWKQLRGRLQVTDADAEAAVAAFKSDPYAYRPKPGTTPPASAPAEGGGLSVEAPSSQPTTASAPASASAPATRTEAEIESDWDNDPSVREPYFNAQLDQRAARLMKSLVDSARQMADRPWNGVKAPEPDDWVPYSTLVQTVGAEAAEQTGQVPGFTRWLGGLGFGPYTPEIHSTSDYMSAEDLVKLPGIGRAIYQNSQGKIIGFPALATHVNTPEELDKQDKTTEFGRLNLVVGHECPEVTDGQGNVYLFRVTALKKSQAPDALDQVRAQVVEDCKKRHAYDATLSAVEAALKKSPDLKSLADQYHSTVLTPDPFTQEGQEGPPAGLSLIRGFLDAAFALPAPNSEKPSVTTVQNEESLTIFPLRVLSSEPAKVSVYFENRWPMYSDAAQHETAVREFMADYLKVKAIAQRLNFTLAPGTNWGVKDNPAQP